MFYGPILISLLFKGGLSAGGLFAGVGGWGSLSQIFTVGNTDTPCYETFLQPNLTQSMIMYYLFLIQDTFSSLEVEFLRCKLMVAMLKEKSESYTKSSIEVQDIFYDSKITNICMV